MCRAERDSLIGQWRGSGDILVVDPDGGCDISIWLMASIRLFHDSVCIAFSWRNLLCDIDLLVLWYYRSFSPRVNRSPMKSFWSPVLTENSADPWLWNSPNTLLFLCLWVIDALQSQKAYVLFYTEYNHRRTVIMEVDVPSVLCCWSLRRISFHLLLFLKQFIGLRRRSDMISATSSSSRRILFITGVVTRKIHE